MRNDLPPEIQARINFVQQTLYNNADPRMEAVIVKANRTLDIQTISTGTVGSIDLAAKIVDGTVTEIWIISVVDAQAVVNVYTYAETIDFTTPDRTFTLDTEEAGAKVRDVSIAFDGDLPWLFWVERGVSYDKIFALQWDGTGTQPAGTELVSVAR
jgi:hypothetical protein